MVSFAARPMVSDPRPTLLAANVWPPSKLRSTPLVLVVMKTIEVSLSSIVMPHNAEVRTCVHVAPEFSDK
jgi:hypothetical protein